MPETPITTRQPREMPFKMGADPEFLIFHGTRLLEAKKIITYFLNKNSTEIGTATTTGNGQTTAPPNNMGFKIGEHGELGWDGASSTAEIRPTPEKNIDKLTEHISALLKEANNSMPFADLTTLSIGNAAGGHIHIEITGKHEEILKNPRNLARATKAIATFLIPIIASDHRVCAANRIKGQGYGAADDIRIENPAPKVTTIEIRGQSAEWMTTEKLTRSTLAYVGVVWNEIINNLNKISKEEIVFKNKPQITAIQDMVIANYKPLFDNIINQIGKTVKKFELYPEFKDEIDFILNTQAVYAEKEKNGWNINQGWGFKQNKSPTKRDLVGIKKTKKLLKNIDMEIVENSLSIGYNDDRYVSNFANAISERIAAFNWKLEHNYFLFGLARRNDNFVAGSTVDLIKNKDGKEDKLQVYVSPSNATPIQIKLTLINMWNKIRYSNSNNQKIDPKSGKTLNLNSDTILIGIPYEIREENKIKNLIELIWKIENNKLSPQNISKFTAENKTPANDIEETKRILSSGKEPVLSRPAVEIINQEIAQAREENYQENELEHTHENGYECLDEHGCPLHGCTNDCHYNNNHSCEDGCPRY